MPSRRRAFSAPTLLLACLALTPLGGCTYEQEGPPDLHFEKFDAKPPKLDKVTVCHAYGCKEQTPFTFTQADIAELSALMARVPRTDSPAEERRAIAYAIAWMERRVAPTVGTASDRASMDFGGSGDSTQQDCVDEATNTTSYLLVLERHGLHQASRGGEAFRQGQPDALDALGGGDQGDRQRRALRHRFLGGRQWRKPDGAGRGKLLRA